MQQQAIHSTNPSNPVQLRVQKEAESMAELKVYGHTHIIRPYTREGTEPNYRNTGMAFCGILKPNQTFNQFKSWWTKKRVKFVNL